MKPYLYAMALLVVLAAAKWGYDAVWESGWNAAIVEQEQAIRAAQESAVAKARQQWENLTENAEKHIVVEEKIVERVKVVEKEIPKIVERIVTVTPECDDLGLDFAGLLNKQVRSSRNHEVQSATVASDADP